MALEISYNQSSDGKTLTFVDESAIASPISNYTRTVQLWSGINGTGSLITTLTFAGSELTVDYAITEDRYWSARLIYIGSPTQTSVVINFVSRRFELNLLISNSKKNCGCTTKNCDSKFNGFIDYYLANEATKIGNSGAANLFISSSYKWLNR